MHEKGRKLIKEAMKRKTIIGLDKECPYFPCHEGLEDCTFCYCPFYPCYETDTGGFEKLSSITKEPVWACSSCIFPHVRKNAEKILKGLIELDENFDLISRENLLALRKKILKENKKE
ncbi:MAG: cysteine-rich small domain-containing protein [Promethearchaeota archaeon]